MALKKEIRLYDGIIAEYHRILFIEITTNCQNSIAVLSYIDEQARIQEKEDLSFQPYRRSVTYIADYTPDMTIEDAYIFLKSLPDFKDAIDV